MNLLDRFFWRIGDLAERFVVALESLDTSKEVAPAAPKPKRPYRRQAPGSIHPDQCPWCLGFDARTVEQRKAMQVWRRLHPRSQRTACNGWRRCRFHGPPKPGPQPEALDATRRNSASFATVGELVDELRRLDRGTPVRACAHMSGAVFEFEVGSIFASSGENDVAIMGYGPRRKC
jgi:hypothetical protein